MKKLICLLSLLYPLSVYSADDPAELNAATEVMPVVGDLTLSERLQENSTDLAYIDKETKLPDLPCADSKLLQQVKNFIFANITEQPTNSVISRRDRILLIKNLHNFNEIDEQQISGQNSFMVRSALMNLRINEKKTISHICVSSDNDSKKFKDLYIIIYQYAGYYKVIVANLLAVPEKPDDATFIYNW